MVGIEEDSVRYAHSGPSQRFLRGLRPLVSVGPLPLPVSAGGHASSIPTINPPELYYIKYETDPLGSASFCRARSGCAFLAEADDYHSSEHHDRGKHLLPCQYVHSDDDADDDGYYRLDIAVHADQRRSDPLLSDRD